jgi:hypothetical protein
MNFEPVATLEDLDSLDEQDIIAGYRSAARGDPEPGANRGRAFWHGWRCGMFDLGELKPDVTHRNLVALYLGRERGRLKGQ